ncbi:MAG: hypothetical protein EPN22_02275 [Nitrospirae bacterium]|nr:MAG: hypothetical protein EPN22_02275 [Nitrospirota bacterium]
MPIISNDEKLELLRLASSSSMREDMERVAGQRHNPFIKNGKVDVDAYIEFVTQFNEFINHEPKPFEPMIERDMKL